MYMKSKYLQYNLPLETMSAYLKFTHIHYTHILTYSNLSITDLRTKVE